MNRIRNTRTVSSTAARTSIVPEMLENRTLFAATALVNGVLTVTGTPQIDDVYISYQLSGNKVVVLQRGASGGYAQTAAYAKTSVKSIKATLGDGNDVFYVSGNVGNVPAVVDAGNGNDNLTGGYGNDTLRGGPGIDLLSGSYGNDLLDGGTGKDRDQLFGGAGVDTADYSSRTEALTLTLDGASNDGATGEFDLIYHDIENVTGGKGNDTITGDAFSNVLIGGAGNDTLRGGDGADKLTGGLGLDKLFGEAGNDTLYVRSNPADKDTADGGAGTDAAQKDNLDVLTTVESVLA